MTICRRRRTRGNSCWTSCRRPTRRERTSAAGREPSWSGRRPPPPSQSRVAGLLFFGAQASERFFVGLARIAPGDLLIPGGVEGPGPGLAHRAARHGFEGAGFPDRAQVDVDEDPAQHDQRRDVMHDIADGDGHAAERTRPNPENHPGYQVGDTARHDLPELDLLPGVEEAGVGRLQFLRTRDHTAEVLDPARVGGGPAHGCHPVQSLKSEENYERQAEPGMHFAAERAAPKNGSEPAEQPWQVDAKAREQGKEEEQGDHPVQEARVDAVAQQLAREHFIAADGIEAFSRLVVKALNCGSHGHPPLADPAADAAAPPSRSAGLRPGVRTGRTFPALASPATSRRCSSTGWWDCWAG